MDDIKLALLGNQEAAKRLTAAGVCSLWKASIHIG